MIEDKRNATTAFFFLAFFEIIVFVGLLQKCDDIFINILIMILFFFIFIINIINKKNDVLAGYVLTNKGISIVDERKGVVFFYEWKDIIRVYTWTSVLTEKSPPRYLERKNHASFRLSNDFPKKPNSSVVEYITFVANQKSIPNRYVNKIKYGNAIYEMTIRITRGNNYFSFNDGVVVKDGDLLLDFLDSINVRYRLAKDTIFDNRMEK